MLQIRTRTFSHTCSRFSRAFLALRCREASSRTLWHKKDWRQLTLWEDPNLLCAASLIRELGALDMMVKQLSPSFWLNKFLNSSALELGTCRRALTSPQLSQWCSPLTCSLFNYKLGYVKGFTISLVTKVGKTPPDKAASEGNKLGACLKVLTITGSLQRSGQ